MWLPWQTDKAEEPGLRLGRLKPGQARGPKRLVPWWVGAMRRATAASVTRRQSPITAEGGGRRRLGRSATHVYGRRSIIKASFRRNRGKGAWVRHARYLARENAQRELERGRGFDAVFESLDLAKVMREWERGDEILWSFIVSPEDADRIDLRRHARDFVAGMERDLGTQLEWIAIDHHNTDDVAYPLADPRRARQWESSEARPRLHHARSARTESGAD